MDSKTPADLSRYIEAHYIHAEVVRPPHETPTVPLAARAMNCREDQIVKSVLFLVRGQAPDAQGSDEKVVLVITNGTAPIDFRKLAEVFGVGRKKIKLAPPDVVLARTGYPAGGVPPFGYDQPVATFLDRSVLDQPTIYAGGGDERTLLRTTPEELLRVTEARIIDAR